MYDFFKKYIVTLLMSHKLYLLLPFFLSQSPLFASDNPLLIHTDPNATQSEKNELSTANGIITFDYEKISLVENGSIDLFGMHYLHQFNDWFYFGFGAHAPLVKGEYGGFMTLDATIHAQKKLYDKIFINAGYSLGGGGGGSSISQSRELSGTGGFIKKYIGLGYEFDNKIAAGVNYTNFKFIDSEIDNSQFSFFLQMPVSYSVGLYANAGSNVNTVEDLSDSPENIFTVELNNMFQINPTGISKETINNISLQYSHFLDEHNYLFSEIEVGYKGLPLYNHFLHGIGYKTSLSSQLNLYSQIGIGSGGFSPKNIDTGAGLLLYPKVSLEYLVNHDLGVSVTGGYLYAPMGTSKNYTAGVALNYHLSNKRNRKDSEDTEDDLIYKGFRFSIFPQTEFAVKVHGKDHHNINMISTQFDKLLNDNWYVATQVSVAYNEFQTYPGYGEALLGIGIQNKYLKENQFQNFFQILMGANIHGVIFKPSIGTNYSLSDHYALHVQLGSTISADHTRLYEEGKSLSAYHIGVGLTYRFSSY